MGIFHNDAFVKGVGDSGNKGRTELQTVKAAGKLIDRWVRQSGDGEIVGKVNEWKMAMKGSSGEEARRDKL